MRFSSDEEIKATVALARKTLVKIASKGTAISYQEIISLGSLENVVPFLEDRGFLIINKPTVASNVQYGRPSTSASTALTVPHHTAAVEDIAAIPVPDEEMEVTLIPADPEEEVTDTPFLAQPEDPREDQHNEEGRRAHEDDSAEEESDRDFQLQLESEEESNQESGTTGNFDDRTQRILQTKWTVVTRQKMKAAGLYKRHSLDEPILKGFAYYLQHTLDVPNYKQEVENLARFLYYMNPQRPNLDFVSNIEKVNSFFTKLRDLKLANQTVFNYLKHIRRFMTYQLRATNLSAERPRLFKSCNFFMDVTEDIQKRLSKGISREVVSKRYKSLTNSMKTPPECQRLLVVAKPTFLKCLKAAKDRHMKRDTQLEIIYYLEALLILRHLQRPGVVRHMTVSEWNERITHRYLGLDLVVVGVKLHKTSTHQVATYVLTKEEEMWFNVYFEIVRPMLLKNNMPTEVFFLSTSGKEIYNVSNDILRYHTKYKLPNITSQLVRRICETWTLPNFSDSEKCLFAKYLAHTNMTAERNYREKTLTDICHGYMLVMQAGGEQPQASTSRQENIQEGGQGIQREDITSHEEAQEQDYSAKEDWSESTDRGEKESLADHDDDDDDDDDWTSRAQVPSSLFIRTRSRAQRQRGEGSSSGADVTSRDTSLSAIKRVPVVLLRRIDRLLQDHLPEEDKIKRTLGHQLWGKNHPRVKDILDQWKKK
ncbi:uncharacterized protein LOC142656569 [Rhinoderma darwinii]